MKKYLPMIFRAPDQGGAAVAEQPARPVETSYVDTPPGDADNPFIKALTTDPDAPKKEEAPKTEKKESAPEPKKEPESKPDKKSDVPRKLFKKSADPAPETKTEPPTSEIDAIKEPEGLSENNKTGWEAIRGKAKHFESEAKTQTARVSELEKRLEAVSQAEKDFEAAKARNAELEKLVERTNVEAHPKFQEKYVAGRQKLVDAVQSLIKDNGKEPDSVASALALKGKPRIDALREIADDLPGYQQGLLGNLIMQLDTLDSEAAEKRSDSAKYLKEMGEERAREDQRSRETFRKEAESAFDQALRKVRGEYETFQKSDDHAQWNEDGEKIIQQSRAAFLDNDNMVEAAVITLKAGATDVYRNLYIRSDEALEKAEAKVAELTSELQKIHDGGPRAADGGSDPQAKPVGFIESLESQTGMNRNTR